MDQDTELSMQKVIREQFEACTVVMISHHLGMIMAFDTVIVMNQGRLVQTGYPQQLVQMEGSRFREMWMIENRGRAT